MSPPPDPVGGMESGVATVVCLARQLQEFEVLQVCAFPSSATLNCIQKLSQISSKGLRVMMFRVWGAGFRVQGAGCMV
jgi:hypothetical protein